MRVCIRVFGIVQGVGFRPTVKRHADACDIAGSVSNKGPYVEIFAEGSEECVHSFIKQIQEEPPTLGTNWMWRMGNGDFTKELAGRIRSMTKLYGR